MEMDFEIVTIGEARQKWELKDEVIRALVVATKTLTDRQGIVIKPEYYTRQPQIKEPTALAQALKRKYPSLAFAVRDKNVVAVKPKENNGS